MDVPIFYAWQTDRPEKVNRNLIRDAGVLGVKYSGRVAVGVASHRDPAQIP